MDTEATRVRCDPAVDLLPAGARDRLNEREATGSVYEGADWYRQYAATVHRPEIVQHEFWSLSSGSCSSTVDLVLPMQRVRSTLWRGTCVRSLANYYTGVFRPAARPGLAQSHWDRLIREVADGEVAQRRRADRIVLEPLSEDDVPTLRAACEAAGILCREEVAFGNWYEDVRTGFPAYWAARPGALRSTANRGMKRFLQAGGRIDIVSGDDASALDRAAHDYAEVYAASWKPAERDTNFVPSLIRLAAARGWLRLGIARLHDRPLAAHLWLVHANRAEIFKLAYAADAAAWSAGTLLGRVLMEHVIEVDGVGEVDYLTGDDPYKQLWMSRRRVRWRLDGVNARTPRGWLHFLARRFEARHRPRS